MNDYQTNNGTVKKSLTTGKLSTQELNAQKISTTLLNFSTPGGVHITRQDVPMLTDYSNSIYFGLNSGPSLPISTGNTALGAASACSAINGTAIGANATAAAGAVAVGKNSNATGINSVVVGNSSSASLASTIAIGASANAAGTNSVAIGKSSSAPLASSLAVGDSANAAGTNSLAIGKSSAALQGGAIAVGESANAAETNSVAIGKSSAALLGGAIAVGVSAISAGTNSVAVGESSIAGGNASVAIGEGANANNLNSIAIGNGAIISLNNGLALPPSLAPLNILPPIVQDCAYLSFNNSTGQCGPGTIQPQCAIPFESVLNTPGSTGAFVGELKRVRLSAGTGESVIYVPLGAPVFKGLSCTISLTTDSNPGLNDYVEVRPFPGSGQTVNNSIAYRLNVAGQSATFNYDGISNWQITWSHIGPAASTRFGPTNTTVRRPDNTLFATIILSAVKTGKVVNLEFDALTFTAPTPSPAFLTIAIPWAECYAYTDFASNFVVISNVNGAGKITNGLQLEFSAVGNNSTIQIGAMLAGTLNAGNVVSLYPGNITYNTL